MNDEFLEELKNKGGKIIHDYSNDVHYNYILNSFGGKEILERDYPTIYEFLENTRRISLENSKRLKSDKKDYIDDLRNDFEISGINFGPRKSLESYDGSSDNKEYCVNCASRAILTQESPFIAITGYLWDQTEDKLVSGIGDFIENSLRLESTTEASLPYSLPPRNKEYKAHVDFSYIVLDNDKEVLKSVTLDSDIMKLFDGASIVEEIIVDHPMNNGNPSRSTEINYNRDGGDYDETVTIEGKKFDLVVPFKGRVKLNPNFKVLGVDKNEKFKLQVIFEKGSANHNNLLNFDEYFKKDEKDESVLVWEVPKEWKTEVNIDNISANNMEVDFYCGMTINCKNKFGFELNQRIAIDSETSKHPIKDPTVKYIPKIKLLWGCVAKDTKIKMFNGSEKCVQELKSGDEIIDYTGKKLILKKLIIGKEEKMVNVETYEGKKVVVTQSHPVYTDAGIKHAGDLNPVMSIKTEKGFEKIKFCYTEIYNDFVYSLKFEGENGILCNGLVLGDFNLQNSNLGNEKKEKKVYSEKIQALQKEFKNLVLFLSNGGKNNE